MSGNKNLNDAKDAKFDEFYTDITDIQSEINHYEKAFANKTVLCNCDDPFESNFCKFFIRNFNYLHLKRLICTSYSGSSVLGTQMSLFDDENLPLKSVYGYVMDIKSVPMENGRGVSDQDIDRLLHSENRGVYKLKGNGDFQSQECIEYLKQADIVVTNPPFSKFRLYVQQLLDYKKSFLIIGNLGAVGYENILKAFMDGKIWIGYECGAKTYKVPDTYDHEKSFVENGVRYAKMGNTLWYTNLFVSTHNEMIDLYETYDPKKNPTYVNYDAIEVSKIKEIPNNYFGKMGVPLSFVESYNPKQFEIIGFSGKLAGRMDAIASKNEYCQGGPRFYLKVDNEKYKYHRLTDRIVIQRRTSK
jgi:hypothetical protein